MRWLIGLLALGGSVPGNAAEIEACRTELIGDAVHRGIPLSLAEPVVRAARPLDSILHQDRNQPEATLGFDTYLQRLLPDRRVKAARAALAEHGALLAAIESRFEIDRELLVALWTVETDLGRHTGDTDLFDALLTLACDDRRPGFFRRELMAALELLDQRKLMRSEFRGSWAGALGYLQFLPSVVLRHGQDANHDGHIDLFTAGEELFATAARHLAAAGWRLDQPWGVELASVPQPCVQRAADCNHLSPAQWQALPLKPADGRPLPRIERSARIVTLVGVRPRHFLLFPNHEAILVWNRSDHYATTVGLLYDQLQH